MIREEINEMEEARTRQVYDPEDKSYDERKMRVTDMEECTRIHLPKPLGIKREAEIELRREAHKKVSEGYRKEKCDERDNQEDNLTKQERRGLKSLEKRKKDGEIIITMTDKSSKLCIMKREDYLRLGEDHVSKDLEVDRREVQRREKLLNQHSISWCKIWRTGEGHDHTDRVRAAKITRSENRADLYLSYKDHKSMPGKTRPIATG